MPVWADTKLIKSADFNVRWYQDGVIDIIASDGDMRRSAIDIWATMLREILDYRPSAEPNFVMLDLTGPKQSTTPYSMGITRQMAQYVTEKREGKTYAAVIMKNALLVGIIKAFFYQHFATQEKLIYRLFTDDAEGMAWLQEQVQIHSSTSE
jgi:hypothetical protein